MNNAEFQQLRILGELISSQKERVGDLLEHNKLNMPQEAIEFSRALLSDNQSSDAITTEQVNNLYERSFSRDDSNKEYDLIAKIIINEINNK